MQAPSDGRDGRNDATPLPGGANPNLKERYKNTRREDVRGESRATIHVDPSLASEHGGLRLHAFPRGRGPLDGLDDLVAPDGIGEIRHGVGPVVDVFSESCIGTPDVVGRCSY